jgi:hypothetical protein
MANTIVSPKASTSNAAKGNKAAQVKAAPVVQPEPVIEDTNDMSDEDDNEDIGEDEDEALTDEELAAQEAAALALAAKAQDIFDHNEAILEGLDAWGIMEVVKVIRVKVKDNSKAGFTEKRVKFTTIEVPAPYPFPGLAMDGLTLAITHKDSALDDEGEAVTNATDPRLYGYADKRFNAMHEALLKEIVVSAKKESKVSNNGTAKAPTHWDSLEAAMEGIRCATPVGLPNSWDTLFAKTSKVTASIVRDAMAVAAKAWTEANPKELAIGAWQWVIDYDNSKNPGMPTGTGVKDMLKRPTHALTNDAKAANAHKFMVTDNNVAGYMEQLFKLNTPGALQALSIFEEGLGLLRAESEIMDDSAY